MSSSLFLRSATVSRWSAKYSPPPRASSSSRPLTNTVIQPLPGTAGPWRDGIGNGAGQGIGLDSPTGFRFLITYNRALFLPTWKIVALRVNARG